MNSTVINCSADTLNSKRCVMFCHHSFCKNQKISYVNFCSRQFLSTFQMKLRNKQDVLQISEVIYSTFYTSFIGALDNSVQT